MSPPSTPLGVLLRFHLRSTVRWTLRNAAIQAVLTFVAVGLTPDPDYLISQAARAVAGGERAALGLFAAWFFINAAAAQGVLRSTLSGWHRHLALGRDTRRRAAVLALACCQAPVFLFALALWVLGFGQSYGDQAHWHVDPDWAALGALFCLVPAAAVAATRWQPRWTGLLGLAALGLPLIGGFLSLGAACAGLALHDRLGPAPAVPHSGPRKRRRRRARPRFFLWRITWRAVGPWPLISGWFWAAMALGAVALFIRNNDLQPWEETVGARVGASLGLIAVWLTVAGVMRRTRPPWPWLRSLPHSAAERLLWDAGFLTLLSLPIWIGATVAAPWALPPLAAATLFQTVRLAGALHREQEGITRLGAAAVGEVWVLQAMVAAWPGLAWILLFALPWAVRHGAEREQAMKVSRFRERHHALQGDSTL